MACRILAQLNVETGVPIGDLDGLVVGIIVFNLLAALLPATGKLVLPEEELESRPKGVLQDPKISVLVRLYSKSGSVLYASSGCDSQLW